MILSKRLLLLLFLISFIPCLLMAASSDMLFEAGNRAYLDGDWHEALSKWNEIETSGRYGGELFYNMGNAYFKIGEIGEAILYWEKATLLMGDDDDLGTNLQIARGLLEDRLDVEVRLPVWDWFDGFRARFSAGLLVGGAILLSFLLFLGLGLRRWFLVSDYSRDWLKWTSWVLVLLLVLNFSLLFLKARDDSTVRYGVLVIPEAEILSAPNVVSGKLLFTLHEGTKVRVVRHLENWYEVSIGKERQGWVEGDALGIIF
ncbi:MAG: tetratricopeptide repeat protein [Candidatus Electryoneaceae bacterium]|nr:tetratricopeptide repeat protein [Candidatus Electryoneaceae bacterium]